MLINSVNCGLPKEVVWHGRRVTTSIYKEPVAGRVLLRKLNLEGDRQADLSVHGGAAKAVYCYPLSHYDYWKTELPGRELPTGMFGENFTVDSFSEDEVRIGDTFEAGTATVFVTQPRLPCYKLGIRFGDDEMVKRFLASGRTGFYVAVEQEGVVGAGDSLRLIRREEDAVSVADITRLYLAKQYEEKERWLLQRALRSDALPESWKQHLRERMLRASA